MEKCGRQSTAPTTVFTLASACIGSLLGGLALLLSAVPLLQLVSPLLLLLGAGIGMLMKGGNILGAGNSTPPNKEVSAGSKGEQAHSLGGVPAQPAT
jgi:hypothetical protein